MPALPILQEETSARLPSPQTRPSQQVCSYPQSYRLQIRNAILRLTLIRLTPWAKFFRPLRGLWWIGVFAAVFSIRCVPPSALCLLCSLGPRLFPQTKNRRPQGPAVHARWPVARFCRGGLRPPGRRKLDFVLPSPVQTCPARHSSLITGHCSFSGRGWREPVAGSSGFEVRGCFDEPGQEPQTASTAVCATRKRWTADTRCSGRAQEIFSG